MQLAEILGIPVSPNESIQDARIIPFNTGFQIEYNPIQKRSRINFSISHEIGHFLFPDCAHSIRNREKKSFDKELELLCDIAAFHASMNIKLIGDG